MSISLISLILLSYSPMATVLVQQGVLGVGDVIVAGSAWARIRQMVDDGGKVVRKAGVSMPARVSGWRGLPQAGECIVEVESEVSRRKRGTRLLCMTKYLFVSSMKHVALLLAIRQKKSLIRGRFLIRTIKDVFLWLSRVQSLMMTIVQCDYTIRS